MADEYQRLMQQARRFAEAGDVAAARRAARLAQQYKAPSGGVSTNSEADKPWYQTLRENIVGDDDPTTQNTGEKIGTWLNKAGEALTFGLVGDEASAAVAAAIPGGMGYDERLEYERGQEELLEKTNPGAALTADVGGAVLGALTPMGAIGTLGRGANMGARLAASGAAGAGMGGTYGFMEGEGLDDRLSEGQTGAKIGAAAGAAAPVIGAGVQKVADALVGNRAISQAARNAPTTDQLRAQAKQLYGAVDDADVQITPEAFSRMRAGMTGAMRDVGLDELPGPGSLTPKSARVNQIAGEMSDRMATEPTAALPMSSLDQLRRHAGTAAADTAPMTGRATPDARIGMEAVNTIDDFVANLGPGDVTTGDLDAIKTLLPKARDMYARMSRSQLVDDALDNSDNYLSGRASGIRNQFRRILGNKKLSRGFSEAERKVMQKVAQGSLPEQLLYLAGGGLGNLGMIGLGATAGPIGALAGVGASAGLRKGAEAVAERNAQIARAIIANGGLKQLPVASDQSRRIVEALTRRTAAAGPQ